MPSYLAREQKTGLELEAFLLGSTQSTSFDTSNRAERPQGNAFQDAVTLFVQDTRVFEFEIRYYKTFNGMEKKMKVFTRGTFLLLRQHLVTHVNIL